MGGVPSKPNPSKTMQVIGASMSRTGTNSVQLALEHLLDGPVIHGGTVLISGSDNTMWKWLQALKASHAGDRERALKYTREVTAGYVGTVDLPCIALLEEMMELYPDAKVLLVTRDPQKWWPSIAPLIENGMNSFHLLLMSIYPGLRWFPAVTSYFTIFFDDECARLGKRKGDWGPWLIENYNERVIEMVPREKLLVMNLSEGWEPLCKFLGRPVPDVPFPRTNDADEAERTAKRVVRNLFLAWVGLLTTVGVSGYGAFKFWKMY